MIILATIFVIAQEILIDNHTAQVGKISFYILNVSIGFCLKILIGFQITKLAPENKLINTAIYSFLWAFIYVLAFNLLFEPTGQAQYQLIGVMFSFSLGFLIYFSDHKDQFDLTFFYKK
ncbi:hypothetical protein [Acinetobacter sp.]|uniref:hypothetical protein n=1 Tax=Acinetobacter sp. TaxID=472 RepID=UPI003B00A167